MKRLTFLLTILFFPSLCFGADVSSTPPQITLSVDADLIAFVKITIWLGGIFLAVYALLGVTFFGFDVQKARGSLSNVQKEIKEKIGELQKDFEKFKALKESLEELGSKLQEDIESKQRLTENLEELGAKLQEDIESKQGLEEIPESKAVTLSAVRAETAVGAVSGTRSNLDLIREVIASSNYEWSSIGRIMKKTGLSHEEILKEGRSAPDIKISFGNRTKDYIFKFNETKSMRRPILRNMYPLPESPEAIELGCRCAVARNADGMPALDQYGQKLFVIQKGCPIHG